jgi:hypothetical protein
MYVADGRHDELQAQSGKKYICNIHTATSDGLHVSDLRSIVNICLGIASVFLNVSIRYSTNTSLRLYRSHVTLLVFEAAYP